MREPESHKVRKKEIQSLFRKLMLKRGLKCKGNNVVINFDEVQQHIRLYPGYSCMNLVAIVYVFRPNETREPIRRKVDIVEWGAHIVRPFQEVNLALNFEKDIAESYRVAVMNDVIDALLKWLEGLRTMQDACNYCRRFAIGEVKGLILSQLYEFCGLSYDELAKERDNL